MDDAQSSVKVDEGISDNEFLVTRHGQLDVPINVINVYGQQEGRMTKEDIDKQWSELLTVIHKIEAREEWLVCIGDFNRHLGCVVPGNSPDVTYGGELVNRFLESPNYVLLNSSSKTTGGPWTREDPANSKSKSVLDLVIISVELEKYVKHMKIDNERAFTPFKRNNSNNKMSFPDHYAVEVIFHDIPLRSNLKSVGVKYTLWNTNKPNGWQKFHELTTNNKKLDSIANDPTNDANVIMKIIEKELKVIQFEAFGKVKVKRGRKGGKLEELMKKKEKLLNDKDTAQIVEVDHEIIEHLRRKEKNNYEKEIENLNALKEKKGRSAVVFNLKDRIVGNKKDSEEPTAIIDPKTLKKTFTPSKIIKVCADYVQELLAKKEPKEAFKDDIEWKHEVHKVRMSEMIENDVEMTNEMFFSTLDNLKKKGGTKYNLITKAGKSLKNALLKLYKVVWDQETIPDSWRETTVIQLKKGNKDPTDLSNKRFIHIKPPIPKLFSQIVTNKLKPIITQTTSPFQIGAIPGHRSEEHLFTLKSVVMLAEDNDSALAAELLDLVKYFDSEWHIDNLDELHKGKVKGKLYRLVYEINKETNVKVRTPVGNSDVRDTKENLAQGSPEAGIISAQSLSQGVDDFFSSSESEVSYGPLRLLPQSFQDDLMRLCLDPISAQQGNDRFESLADSKRLSYNMKKSFVVIMGKKKQREELKKQFEENPPKIYGIPLKIVDQQSYLGEELGPTVSESITLTINKRIGIATKAMYDIKTIIEDIRCKVPGGIRTAVTLWECCVIPFLLNNCSSWMRIRKSDMDRLDKFHNLFLNNILGTFNCPISLMYWDLCMLTMHHRILKEKLVLFHHISCLPHASLAGQFLDLQQRLHFPGITDEVQGFLNRHEIVDVRKYTKIKWKNMIKRLIKGENRDFLIKTSQKYKKIDYLSLADEEYETKDYFSKYDLAKARIKFKQRSNCMPYCKMHSPSDKLNIETLFECPEGCGFQDSIFHWRRCRAYEHLRNNKNLDNEFDLLSYYQNIINLRKQEQSN